MAQGCVGDGGGVEDTRERGGGRRRDRKIEEKGKRRAGIERHMGERQREYKRKKGREGDWKQPRGMH